MKHLKYFLIVFILLLCPNVFAADINVNSSTSATRGGTKNRYSCLETYQYGSLNTCTFGTTYNGRMGQFEGFIYYPFEGQTNYTLTLNMSSDDFRNNFKSAWYWDCEHNSSWTNLNTTVIMPTYVNYRKVRLNITPSENMTCLGVIIRSKNYPSDAFTGVNNWTLSNIILTDPTYSSGGSGTSPTPTPSTGNQDIINNQNDNTNDIISNANENTEKIVDAIEDKCTNKISSKNYTRMSGIDTSTLVATDNGISFIGNTVQTASNYVAYDLSVSPNTNYYLSVENNPNLFIVFTTNYTTIARANSGTTSLSFNSGNNETLYFLFYADGFKPVSYNHIMLSTENKPFCVFGSSSNRLDETANAIKEQNDYLMDNSDPNIHDNEFTSLFDSVTFNDPLSSLLQLPVQFINAIVNQSNSCQVVNLGTLLGIPITLPCIDIGSIVGSSVWNTIDILSAIGLIVLILKQMYESVINALTLGGYMEAKKGGLGYMTPLEYLCFVITGGGGDI